MRLHQVRFVKPQRRYVVFRPKLAVVRPQPNPLVVALLNLLKQARQRVVLNARKPLPFPQRVVDTVPRSPLQPYRQLAAPSVEPPIKPRVQKSVPYAVKVA